MPDGIDVDHPETPSPLNPLGIEGAGEVMRSRGRRFRLRDRGRAEGIPITAMPISPSELFELRRTHAATLEETS